MSSRESIPQRVDVLLVEDSDPDARLVQLALEDMEDKPALFRVRDGYEAMAFLQRWHPYQRAPRPRLVLLDINLPGPSGHDVLKQVKEDAEGVFIPVVVFSSSVDPLDLRKAYANGANALVQKPMDISSLMDTMKGLISMWLRTVRTVRLT